MAKPVQSGVTPLSRLSNLFDANNLFDTLTKEKVAIKAFEILFFGYFVIQASTFLRERFCEVIDSSDSRSTAPETQDTKSIFSREAKVIFLVTLAALACISLLQGKLEKDQVEQIFIVARELKTTETELSSAKSKEETAFSGWSKMAIAGSLVALTGLSIFYRRVTLSRIPELLVTVGAIASYKKIMDKSEKK